MTIGGRKNFPLFPSAALSASGVRVFSQPVLKTKIRS
jgi:hypothetical protein